MTANINHRILRQAQDEDLGMTTVAALRLHRGTNSASRTPHRGGLRLTELSCCDTRRLSRLTLVPFRLYAVRKLLPGCRHALRAGPGQSGGDIAFGVESDPHIETLKRCTTARFEPGKNWRWRQGDG